jgi:hypothetical protein
MLEIGWETGVYYSPNHAGDWIAVLGDGIWLTMRASTSEEAVAKLEYLIANTR